METFCEALLSPFIRHPRPKEREPHKTEPYAWIRPLFLNIKFHVPRKRTEYNKVIFPFENFQKSIIVGIHKLKLT